jgi:hypothetical protein
MNRVPIALCGSALALLLAAVAAQAAPIFNYNWSPDAEKHYADGFSSPTLDHYVHFSNEPPKDASVNPTTHKTHVVATNLADFSSADDGAPDNINSNYGLTLVLKDVATGHSHTFTFTGNLSGTFSTGTSNIDNTFTGGSPATWTDSNGDTFMVTMDAYTPPGPPEASLQGSIGATVAFSTRSTTGGGGDNGGGGTKDTPEPSTLLLSFLGLSALGGGAGWRRRRGAVPAGA